jgi:hypothetical protein
LDKSKEHIQHILSAIEPLMLAIDTHESDTLSMLDPDDAVVFVTTGSWSPIRTVTWGDLRSIYRAVEGLKEDSNGLLQYAYREDE